ncbi:MAG: hypothetical protein HZA16_05570 [Nitrospirae bacterium]|nr:hypothetical protein [Nitrospirota bacterium]
MSAVTSEVKRHVDGTLKSKAKNLAEAIILQSMEDLWPSERKSDSRKFFRGKGFKICADIAELNTLEQFKVLHLIGGKGNGRNTRLHGN